MLACVIAVTLVGQGLLLPAVVRWLGLGSHAAEEREREHTAELSARADALNVQSMGASFVGRACRGEAWSSMPSRFPAQPQANADRPGHVRSHARSRSRKRARE